MRFIDEIELLEDNYKKCRNLGLTYAVRDGIISHCGEVDENGLIPREELIDLNEFASPGQYQLATWEGCVVKITDKIAYIDGILRMQSIWVFLTKQQKMIC